MSANSVLAGTESKIGMVGSWDNSGIQQDDLDGGRYFQHACPWNPLWNVFHKKGEMSACTIPVSRKLEFCYKSRSEQYF